MEVGECRLAFAITSRRKCRAATQCQRVLKENDSRLRQARWRPSMPQVRPRASGRMYFYSARNTNTPVLGAGRQSQEDPLHEFHPPPVPIRCCCASAISLHTPSLHLRSSHDFPSFVFASTPCPFSHCLVHLPVAAVPLCFYPIPLDPANGSVRILRCPNSKLIVDYLFKYPPLTLLHLNLHS